MILQKDPYLRPMIQKYGCYYMSILFLVNRHVGRGFDRKDINDLYEFLLSNGWMGKDCFIKKPIDIFKYLGLNGEIRKRGADYECGPGELEILMFERTYIKDGKKRTYSHFVCGNGRGVVTYDPSGVSNAVKYGKLKSKRVFNQ